MKKIISFIVLVFAFGYVICYAAEAATVSLIQKETQNLKEICIDVSISDDSKACGGKIDISYDNSLLKPEKYEIADSFSNGMFLVNLNYDENTVRISWAGVEEISVDTTMCTLIFSVVEDKSFSTVLDISQCKIADINSEPVLVDVKNCEIIYKKSTPSSSTRPGGTGSLSNKDTDKQGTFEAEEETFKFDDVKETDWYFEAVKFAFEKGIIRGVSENLYAPNDKVTRAMLVTVLYRNIGEPAVNESIPFVDVGMDTWYANAVVWAKENGIVNGVSDTEFAPDTNITREQTVAIIFRYAQHIGVDIVTSENNLCFADADEISEYAVSAMNWAVSTSLIKGKSATTICPLDTTTRAEIAVILQRFIENK